MIVTPGCVCLESVYRIEIFIGGDVLVGNNSERHLGALLAQIRAHWTEGQCIVSQAYKCLPAERERTRIDPPPPSLTLISKLCPNNFVEPTRHSTRIWREAFARTTIISRPAWPLMDPRNPKPTMKTVRSRPIAPRSSSLLTAQVHASTPIILG